VNEQPSGIDEAAMAHAAAGTANAAGDLLRARARKMAQEKPAAGADGSTVEVLEFGLAEETYALELAYVREVGALVELTPLPGVPDFVLGITVVHGQIIAVVDLRKVFGLPERGLRDSRQVIVLQSAGREFGILAERVTGVKWLPLAGVQSSLPTLTDVRADYLTGVTPDGTVFLSAGKLLADPRLVVRQET
jgi:purine-binding chemotaxis protein CheW